jgi:hypothetical protein
MAALTGDPKKKNQTFKIENKKEKRKKQKQYDKTKQNKTKMVATF